jgi:hypothetical protein
MFFVPIWWNMCLIRSRPGPRDVASWRARAPRSRAVSSILGRKISARGCSTNSRSGTDRNRSTGAVTHTAIDADVAIDVHIAIDIDITGAGAAAAGAGATAGEAIRRNTHGANQGNRSKGGNDSA